MRTRTAGAAPSVPPRLRRALGAQRAWSGAGVHLAPIRHHSPACALALSALLEQVRPAVVLIEGPAEYTDLLPDLQDPATVPPVAVLSLADRTASYYPLAEFSPEWIALRWAGEHGAEAAFIDRSPGSNDDRDGSRDGHGAAVRTLQAEYHLARSAALDALAGRLGCRDHDEVWEQLFEDRDTADIRDWQNFFADTLAWSGLARLDAEREVLDSDGTHAREAVMAAALRERLPHTAGGGGGEDGGPIVVVTGAFHALALLDALDGTPEAAWLPPAAPRSGGESWLIRYDFARLDSLRGYGAGMPSPGLWQRAWRARTGADADSAVPVGPRGFATAIVLDVITALRGLEEPLGTAQALATVEQAMGLAALRGRAWPGRTDLLDALTSCLVKDDTGLSGNLGAAVAAVFAASDLGRVPAGTASPPLVAEVRERLRALRFRLDDSVERHVDLDTARRPRHRERRELLARLRFAGVGFARQVGGADLVAGTGLGQFVEEWAYAWTPVVEAALVRAAQQAPTLDILVRTRLSERLDGEQRAAALAELLAELAVMGLHEDTTRVCDALETAMSEVSDLAELVEVLHRLASLVEGTGRLRPEHADCADRAAPRLRSMLRRGTAEIARLVAELVGMADDEAAGAVDALIAVRDLLVRFAAADAADAADAGGDVAPGREAVLREVDVLRRARTAAPVLVGCATGIASSTGSLSRREASDAIVARLSPEADRTGVADFLVGLMRASPGVVLHDPDTLTAVTRTLSGLEEPGFLAVLPDLRRAFTALRPTETHRLAERIAVLTGADAARIDVVLNASPADAALGWRIEQDLVASLVRDGLEKWVGR